MLYGLDYESDGGVVYGCPQKRRRSRRRRFTPAAKVLKHLIVELLRSANQRKCIELNHAFNINGCILLAEVLFLRWMLDGRVSRQWLAGIAIGLSLVVKPVLAVLLLLPLLNRQWRTLVTAIALPVAFNALAWPLVVDRGNFIHRTLPYILSTRDYFNSSVLGNGVYYGLPMWLIAALRVGFVVLAAISLWLLNRYYRTRDPLFWMSVDVSAVGNATLSKPSSAAR
jgi:hypothetical protein